MKSLKVLLFLIGMISFTGFSTTTDLTEDSSVIMTVDNDIGIVAVATVENDQVVYMISNLESRSIEANEQKALILFLDLNTLQDNYRKSIEKHPVHYEVDNQQKEITLKIDYNFESSPYRSARDGLSKSWTV